MTERTSPHPDDFSAIEHLIADIQHLESRAYRLGIPMTGGALNRAKNQAGWDLDRARRTDGEKEQER